MAANALTEEIALNLEDAAEVTRSLNLRSIGFLGLGLGVGAAAGFYFGYRYNKQKLRLEILEEAEKEIDDIREHYRQKVVALEEKPALEEIIEQRGYRSDDAEDEETDEEPENEDLPDPAEVGQHVAKQMVDNILQPPLVQEGRLKPPVPVDEDVPAGTESSWNYALERSRRSVEKPYIIHEDECIAGEVDHRKIEVTYFEIDEVFVDDNDQVLTNAEEVIGRQNLRFGHGSSDPDTVFVRNNKLELDIEITRLHKSYEEEELGLERDDGD